ncbi:hypothetical protein I3843_16G111900 [Carya illinoinensis]|nr:hypothetical protein I3843_16G111900 [Carya illinoinensis]
MRRTARFLAGRLGSVVLSVRKMTAVFFPQATLVSVAAVAGNFFLVFEYSNLRRTPPTSSHPPPPPPPPPFKIFSRGFPLPFFCLFCFTYDLYVRPIFFLGSYRTKKVQIFGKKL